MRGPGSAAGRRASRINEAVVSRGIEADEEAHSALLKGWPAPPDRCRPGACRLALAGAPVQLELVWCEVGR